MAGSSLGTVFVELSLDDKTYKQRLSETLTSTEATAKGIETSWRALGTKSDAYFDAQRRSAENAYTLIKNSASATANDIIRAEEAKNAKIKALNEQQYGHQVTLQDKLQKNWLSVTTAIAAAYGALAGGKQLIDAALAMERINSAMSSSVGDSNKAARELQYVREESLRLGLNLNDTALAYSKFAASARGTSIEGEQTRKIFSSVSEAATALRLPTEQASGIFLALSQMMSKGKVQAEELRGQLGERLPGAFSLAADAMGVTTAELDEMLKKGEVTASEMLPLLADKLHETYGNAATEAAKGGQAAINRFNNAAFETKVVMGESILPVFTDFLGIVQKTTPYITAFIGGIKMSAVEVFGWIDKVDAVLTHASKYTDPTQWGIISTSDLKKRLKEIDGNVEKTKEDIVKNIDKVKSSSISAADKAAQAVINAERKKQEASTKASDASTKAAEAAAKKQEQAEKQLADELAKTIADRKKYEGTYYEWKAAEIEVGLNKYIEAGVSEEKIAELRKEKLINLNDEIFKQYKKTLSDWEADTRNKQAKMIAEEEKAAQEEIKRAEERRAAMKDLYKDLLQYSGDYYEVEKSLIDERALNYETILIDEKTSVEDAAKFQVAIAQWRENELKKLDIERGKRSDDFFAGLNAHILETEKNQVRWGKAGYETFKTFSSSASSVLSNVLFDGAKRQMKSFQDYWTSFTDSLLRKFVDTLAQMAVEWVTYQMFMRSYSAAGMGGSSLMGAMGMGGMMATGGGGGASMLLPAAGGGYYLASGAAGTAALAEAGMLAEAGSGVGGALVYGSPEYAAALSQLGITEAGVGTLGASGGWMASLSAAAPWLLGGFAVDQLLLGGKITSTIGNVVGSVIDTASNVVNSVGDAIADVFGWAKGGVFEHGMVTPYAAGGIVTAPTIFPMSRGMGLMGEAGPEAVMPLARGRDGRLGVQASGNGGGAQMINVRVFIGDTELRSLVRVEADGVIVARNSRGVNSSMRVYQ